MKGNSIISKTSTGWECEFCLISNKVNILTFGGMVCDNCKRESSVTYKEDYLKKIDGKLRQSHDRSRLINDYSLHEDQSWPTVVDESTPDQYIESQLRSNVK